VAIASTGTQTITVNAAQGPVPAKNSSYTGAGNNNTLNSPITLQPGGVITISIPVTIKAGTSAGTNLSNQTTANGDGLPVQGLLSDNVDQTTTALPAGVTVPADSVLQTQTVNSLDPTTATVTNTRDYLLSPYRGKVIINEVLYNQSGANTVVANDEFIELYNASSEVVDLTGWKLIDGNLIGSDTDGSGSITGNLSPFIFGNSTFATSGTPILQPGQYAVIWVGNPPSTSTSSTQAAGATFQAWLKQGPQLNNNGDDIWLYDSQTKIVDYVTFGANNAINIRPPTTLSLWDAKYESQLTTVKGQSLSLTPNGIDGNTSACWEPTTSEDANKPAGAPRCPGFLPTRDADSVVVVTGTSTVNRITSVGENNNGPTATTPNVFLVKRITKVNNLSTNPNDGTVLNTFTDDTNTTQDNHPNWPTSGGSYLLGATNGGLVKPSDEVEYTIYFLSSGTSTAKSVQICDRIPARQTFVPDAFNSLAAASNTAPASPAGDRGMAVSQGGTTYGYTNIGDGDAARYYPPGSTLPSACTQTASAEDNGTIVVNLGDVPNSTAPGFPVKSYGFFRFRAMIK
jgi:hypothetical protein